MTTAELKKLNRTELLELLIAQIKANDALRIELEKAKKQLEDKRLNIEKLGSIAEASLQINGVFTAAEAAAAQYVENVKIRCIKSQEQARQAEEQAERILVEARQEAAAIIKEAEQKAQFFRQTYFELDSELPDL